MDSQEAPKTQDFVAVDVEDDIDKVQFRVVDDEEYKKVFDRPFQAPSPDISERASEVRTSHYDYNFDEKDYKSHRKASVRHHGTLHRVPTISKHLSSADRKKLEASEKKAEAKKKARDKSKERIQVLPRIKEKHDESHENDEADVSRDGADGGRNDSTPELEHRYQRHHSRDQQDSDKSKHHHHHRRRQHHRHRYHRTISEREQLESRLRSGTLTLQETEPQEEEEVTDETEKDLPKRDLEEIAWHRFEDLRGIRRRHPHLRPQLRRRKSGMKTHYSSTDITASLQKFPVKYDHSPHEAFVELEELTKRGEEMEWKETARWIKFEEDVEDSNRWGKPHVASLSFHSLLELRKGLERGVVLLDLERFDMPSIAEAVVNGLVSSSQLDQTNSNKVLAALLLRHRHQFEETHQLPRRPSMYNLANISAKSTPEPSRKFENADGEDEVDNTEDKDTARFFIGEEKDEKDSQPVADGEPGDTTLPKYKEYIPLPRLDQEEKPEGKQRGVKFAPETKEEDGGSKSMRTRKKSEVTTKVPDGAEATAVLVGTLDEIHQPAVAFVRLARGCFLGDVMEVTIPVRFLFVLFGPTEQSGNFHEIGRSIATLMSDQNFHDLAYIAESPDDLLSAINQFLEDTVVLPPGDYDKQLLIPVLLKQSEVMAKRRKQTKKAVTAAVAPVTEDPLERTGRFCGGLVRDFKRRLRYYKSDFTDGLNVNCLAASIVLYFAVFFPNVAFGGLLAEKTDNWLGVSEVIFATCLSGILFGLFSGQPLIIVGATGPVLVFEQTVYKFTSSYPDLEFLPWRCWIGFWVMVIMFCVVACEACFLVRYFTRFTEEIFACLISAIFIYEAIHFIQKIFKDNPVMRGQAPLCNSSSPSSDKDQRSHVKCEPNTALLSTVLVLGTFFVAFYLRRFRSSYFLSNKARRVVSDFAVVIAMGSMVLLDHLFGDDVLTPKLSIGLPTSIGFVPTRSADRGWFINPVGLKKSMHAGWIFAAIIPAIFIGILLFMETELTGVLLSKKEYRLKKGAGFNLDLLMMGLLTFLCSLLGLPWMCAATVRSLSHLNALSVWSTSHAPGEKPFLIEIKEQRVTNVAIHVLTGVSILMAPVLHLIPVPVLFGVLLYLGIRSLSKIQLVQRFVMMFMPPEHHRDVRFVRKVTTRMIYVYTVIQLVCLAVLIAVKLVAVIAPSFPFFIICLIPIRKSLVKFFSPQDLEELDNEEAEDDSDIDEFFHYM